MAQQSIHACCLQGFQWDGTTVGEETTIGANRTYVTGPVESEAAILVIHDILGWTFPNSRLLADFYAKEVGAGTYLPDL